ncbi:hypothetical protein B0T26DRAFT_639839, partial [Lasiosphaeria miniovina]
TNDESIRRKFLNCIAELLDHTKGGRYVAAPALREKESSVEIDVTSNSPFQPSDAGSGRDAGVHEEAPAHSTLSNLQDSCCRPLLEVTVARSASRVDGWIKEFAKLVGGTLMLPAAAIPPIDGASPLDLCQDDQLPAILDVVVRELALRVQVTRTRKLKAADRLSIVRLAARIAQSPDAASAGLKRLAPLMNGSKAVRLCRLMARPDANLRTLARIAQLLPSFRAVTFIQVTPPARIRLSREQMPSFADAWERLGLPKSSRLPGSLSRKQSRFRKDCARAFPVHCDAQLLLRYEADPSLAPSLPYIGCSKRACFLCHALLSVLALQIKLRGHHGHCYPLWGVGLAQSVSLRPQFRQLCAMVHEKIATQPCSRNTRPVTIGIPQSSAVSELRSAVVEVLRQQSDRRESLERENQEFRERMQILLGNLTPP